MSTILTRNRTFVPAPDEIADDFMPSPGEWKRLELWADILYIGEQESFHPQVPCPKCVAEPHLPSGRWKVMSEYVL